MHWTMTRYNVEMNKELEKVLHWFECYVKATRTRATGFGI